MLHALFALILIPAGLNALGFRPPHAHAGIWMAPPLSFISVVLCVMMALHLPLSLSACIPIEGGVVLHA